MARRAPETAGSAAPATVATLWNIGAGRGAQTTDVLIAATAIGHDAVVVHNGTDFLTLQRAVPHLDQLRIVPPSVRLSD